MTIQPGANVYTQGFGSRPENVEVPHIDARAPASTDINYPLGKRWIFTGNAVYELIGFTTSNGVTSATWVESAGGSGSVAQLTGDTGTATPAAGSIKIAGTANEITTAASGSTVTLSVPSSFVAPGSITATSGAITATNGNLVLGTAGNKIVSTSVGSGTAAGANSFGTVTLTSGTATVATTAVTANSIIILSRMSVGASTALGILTVGTVTAGTSFVISAATQATPGTPLAADASVIGWMIIN